MKRALALIIILLATSGCTAPNATQSPVVADVSAGYVDSAQCASCHAAAAEAYLKTGMGRSFYRPSAQNAVEDYRTKNTFYHAASDRYYTMIERAGQYFQRRHQVGSDGQPVHVVEERVDYVIGSGNHVRSYLHLTPQKKLVELPIAWYEEKGGYWGINPGYDWQHHSDFRRRVTMECMFCHNAYPDTKKASDRADMEALFPGKIAEGIDCQRCHGPGAEHVREPSANNIINPARLSADRKLEVCLQCHLETTSAPLPYAVRRPGRGVFSYKPGEPLSDYMVHFDHAEGTGHDDKFEIAGSAYRLLKSRCFLESAGALTCTTCHNPHDIQRGEKAAQYYAGVCQGCHAKPIANHTSSQDCVGCHMPKRRTDDVVHAVMTDHWIQRRKPAQNLLAPRAERHGADEKPYQGPVALYYPPVLPDSAENQLIQSIAQVTARSNLSVGLPQLKAALDKYPVRDGGPYFELAKASPDLLAIPLYEAAIERTPDYWPALHRLGMALSRVGQTERAVEFLKRAGALATEGTVLNDLAMLYRQQGRTTEALATLKAAAALDPGLPHVYNNLGGVLLDSGDIKGAEEAFREAVRVQPDLVAPQLNLARLLMSRGDLRLAQFYFERAIRQAAPLDPIALESHLALANLLETQGGLERAVSHYREVLKIEAGSAKAHFGLGSILVMQGKRTEALKHFQLAAASADPRIRAAALDAIRALNSPR